CLWLSGIGSSIAYNWSRPNMKTSVKIIHARFMIEGLIFPAYNISNVFEGLTWSSLFFLISCRLHAQALTLAALAGAAVVEYYDHQSKPQSNVDKYPNQFIAHPQKD
ncbi:unnamed protein product, partial [Musa acuminata subsp. burmannicoides]